MGAETVYASVVSKTNAAIFTIINIRRQIRLARQRTHTPWFGSESKVAYTDVFPDLKAAADRAEAVADELMPFCEALLKQLKDADESFLRRWEPKITGLQAVTTLIYADVRAWNAAAINAFKAKNQAAMERWARFKWDEYKTNLQATMNYGKKLADDILAETAKLLAELNAAALKLAAAAGAGATRGMFEGLLEFIKTNPLLFAGGLLVLYYLYKSETVRAGVKTTAAGARKGLKTGAKAATGQISI